MPVHLCHCNIFPLLPSSSDKSMPITAVTIADKAAASRNILNHSLFCNWTGIQKVKKESNSNTMGKCKNIGCILPITCSHEGMCSLCWKNTIKRRKIILAFKIPSPIFFTICIGMCN